MAKLNAKKTLAAVALAAATFATPALAHAGNYSTTSYNDDCRTNTQDQAVAGAIGAVLGGVLGSQVSGNGARTEGSVLGAVLGGAAGAAIADGNNDCDKIRSRSTYRATTTSRNYNRAPVVTTVRHDNRGYNRGYRTTTRSYDRGVRSYDRGYRNDPVDRINRRMDYLRKQRAELKREQSYYGYSRRIDRRLYDISCELDELKKRKRRVKKVERRRAERHYH
ncbi:glycine zipper 2TM domain-containing protein [Hellea balneolensis]|uniref:glycine zipper 2TM domain-containing protein n=1 Tax=Hellea balneolensis TaxID=287478 RepID=UPI00041774E3|nr:glycine zipper 2TM domain-containing protein [Hellea balneolensis]